MANLYDELGQLLDPSETTQDPPGFRAVKDTDGTILYWEPIPGYVHQPRPDLTPGTALEPSEIPIPFVSLPDKPKENVPAEKPVTKYEVTPDEIVTKTPSEQLTELEPPVDLNAELEKLRPAKPPLDKELIAPPRRGMRLEPLPPEEEPAPEPPPEAPEEDRLTPDKVLENLTKGIGGIRKMTEPVRQAVAKPAAAVAALPWMIGSVPAGVYSKLVSDEAGSKEAALAYHWMQDQGIGAYKGIHSILGAEVVPETPVEYLAGVGGSSVVPGSRAASAAIAGVQLLTDKLMGHPVLKGDIPKMTPEFANWLLTPAEAAVQPATGGWPGSAPAPAPSVPAEKGAKPPKEPKPGKPMIPTPEGHPETPIYSPEQPQSILRKPVPPKPRVKDKPGEYEARFKAYEEARAAWLKQYNPTATTAMETVGGMREIRDGDLWGMGVLGATTIGMITMPYIYRGFKNTLFPRPMSAAEVAVKPVPFAPEGTVTNLGLRDVFRAVLDDTNLATWRAAKRALVPQQELEHLETLLRTQGHAQNQALLEGAMNLGQMITTTQHFSAPVALERLGAIIDRTPQAKEYLILRDILEQHTFKKNQAIHEANQATQELGKQLEKAVPKGQVETFSPKWGPDAMINGLTFDDALERVKAIEAINPEIKKIGAAWDGWNMAKWDYMADGEAATLPKGKQGAFDKDERSQAYLNSQRKSTVPFHGDRADTMSFEDRVTHTNITDAMKHRSRIELGERNKNEIRLHVIDTMRNANEGYFVPVSKEDYASHPQWHPYITKVYRRGEAEYYGTSRTMRDFLTLDPWFIQSGVGQSINAAKKTFESVFTGNLNPLFSIRNAMRVWHGAKMVNNIPGRSNPSVYGMGRSVVDQVYPQFGKWIAEQLEVNGGGRIPQFFGEVAGYTPEQTKVAMETMGRRMAQAADESMYYWIEAHGGARGSTMQSQLAAKAAGDLEAADAVMNAAGGKVKTLWEGYKKSFGAIHEAPMYDYVAKNQGKAPLPQLIAEGRNLGGDPKIGGQYFFRDPETGKVRPLQFESDSRFANGVNKYLMPVVGNLAEINRIATPWANAIIQSVKRVGAAYMDDPIGFTMRTWKYGMAPAAAEYMWNYSMGTDPNGLSYADYDMNRRTKYDWLTKRYFAIPGRPAEDGVQISMIALEFALPQVWTKIAMDHMFGQNKRDLRTDMMQALTSSLDISLNIPLSPVITGWEISQGRVPPLNVFGGEGYTPKKDPYDQYRGMPATIENYVRGLGSLGNSIGSFFAAYSHTDTGFVDGMKNGLREAAKPQLRQIPFHELLFDAQSKAPGTNRVLESYYEQRYLIDGLVQHFAAYQHAGQINTKPASEPGGEVATTWFGPPIADRTPGPPQPKPTNPMYLELMDTMYGYFKRDNPGYDKEGNDLGGVGFLSISRRYGQATRALKSMEHVDAGMMNTWQRWLNAPKQEGVLSELKAAKIDTTNPRQVRNYYENKRQETGLVLWYYTKAAESAMSAKYSKLTGKPVTIKFEDLKPYGTFSIFPQATQPLETSLEELP